MVAGKTAALLGACTLIGALVGSAEPAYCGAYRQFGEALGWLSGTDDWLGIWGDAAITGKSTESDLVTGKKTLPVLYSLEKGGKFAARWQKGPIHSEEIHELSTLLVEEGAQDFTRQTADRLTAQALAALSATGHASRPAAIALRQLSGKLLAAKDKQISIFIHLESFCTILLNIVYNRLIWRRSKSDSKKLISLFVQQKHKLYRRTFRPRHLSLTIF